MRLACAALAVVLFAAPVAAQDKKDAAKRLQAVNQKLTAEKAAWEREKALLSNDKAQLTRERDTLKVEAEKYKGAAARNARKLKEESERLSAELAAAAEREATLKGELAKTTAGLQESQRGAEQLGKRLANQGETSRHWQAKTESCEGKNVELLGLNHELLDRYRAKSCADALAEAEPFTGIGRVRLENLLEEYKDRVSAARFRASDDLKDKEKTK
jgi:chromosome segregation ATPase